MDGYRGREDARARTTEKDEVEELESGAHEMKARGVREREREGREKEDVRGREKGETASRNVDLEDRSLDSRPIPLLYVTVSLLVSLPLTLCIQTTSILHRIRVSRCVEKGS